MINRRDFLVASAVAPALASINPLTALAADDDANRRPIKKANKGGLIGSTPEEIRETLTKHKEAGFDGIEGGSPGFADIHALKDISQELNFPIHGIVNNDHWKTRFSSPDPEERRQGIESFKQSIRDSHFLGGTSVLLVPGKVTGPDETHDDVWRRSIVGIREVLPLAQELSIKVLIENVWNGFCETPQLFRDYIDEIDSEMVVAYFDIGNCRKFGPAEDWIRTLGERIVKLDVKDWGQKNGFCRLGEGDINWPAVGKALDELDYAGWATREGQNHDHSLADTSQLIDELLIQRS